MGTDATLASLHSHSTNHSFMKTQNLYFIAIVPDGAIRQKVKALKEEMKARFNAKHALKSPAHITLIPPFKRDQTHENFLCDNLSQFATEQESIKVELSGFRSFPPRVIYIDVRHPDQIKNIHSSLCHKLLTNMLFHPDELKSKLHPHMTIATRDLTKEAYNQAWLEFEKRAFSENFQVKSLFLLKHNGKFWDIFKEFEFQAI